jgi:hypothetical protein
MAGHWLETQPSARALNGEDEIEAKPFSLAVVELGCRNELVLCLRMKLDAPHRSAERAFLMTFAAGIPTALPDLSSPSQRSASSSQSFSASVSPCSSRLEIRHRARRARSLRESFNAFDSGSRSGSTIPGGYHSAGDRRPWVPRPTRPPCGLCCPTLAVTRDSRTRFEHSIARVAGRRVQRDVRRLAHVIDLRVRAEAHRPQTLPLPHCRRDVPRLDTIGEGPRRRHRPVWRKHLPAPSLAEPFGRRQATGRRSHRACRDPMRALGDETIVLAGTMRPQ